MAQDRILAITHALLIDGSGRPPIQDATVIVRSGRIASVGPAAIVATPPGAQVLDAAGKTVMPGLADMHVHLVGAWDGESVDLMGYQYYFDALLHAGITTVLDAGNFQPFILQLRQEVSAGRVRGPRVYCVGPIVDGTDPLWPAISVAVTSLAQVPKLVERLAKDKVDFIKAYKGLPSAVIRALVSEGRKHDVRVLMDAAERIGSLDVLRDGISAFAHAGRSGITAEAVAFACDEGVGWISTLAVYESFARRRFENLAFLDHPLWKETVPAFASNALRERTAAPVPGEERGIYTGIGDGFPVAMKNVAKLHRAAVMVVAGTDAPYPGVPLGEGLHRELELLVECGLTPLEAISCATRNAALLVNAGNEWGTVEAGKAADLVVVAGRPDLRISETRNIVAVVQGGRRLDRDAMRRKLARGPATRPFSPTSWA